jgi:hypothetical protein
MRLFLPTQIADVSGVVLAIALVAGCGRQASPPSEPVAVVGLQRFAVRGVVKELQD